MNRYTAQHYNFIQYSLWLLFDIKCQQKMLNVTDVSLAQLAHISLEN